MPTLTKVVTICYRLKGKRVPKGTPGAKRVKVLSRKWYGRGIPGVPGRVPLSSDRRTAERMLLALVTQGEQARAGLVRDGPVGPLLEEWAAVVARGSGPHHARTAVRECRAVLDACRVATVADLRARDLGARAEAFVWGLTKGPHARSGRTAASYGKHARQFTRWLYRRKGLLPSDPLAGLDLPSERPAKPRRALTPAELAALVDAAEAGPVRYGLSGPDRALLYLTAAGTGLRVTELAVLTPGHFDLGDVPRVTLAGSETKSGKPAVQYLHPGLAARLRAFLAGRPPADRIWPTGWYWNAARMLNHDLTAARIPRASAEGAVVFHSLRHTYVTMLSEYAPVKVVQDMSRHEDPGLTIGRYSHSTPAARIEAAARLPLPGSETQPGADPAGAVAAVAAALVWWVSTSE